MSAPEKTATVAEVREWYARKAEKLAEQGKDFPEGVSAPGPRGRLSGAQKDYFTKQARKTIVSTPAAAPSGVKARLAEYLANGGQLPEGVEPPKPGRGRLSKALHDFAARL